MRKFWKLTPLVCAGLAFATLTATATPDPDAVTNEAHCHTGLQGGCAVDADDPCTAVAFTARVAGVPPPFDPATCEDQCLQAPCLGVPGFCFPDGPRDATGEETWDAIEAALGVSFDGVCPTGAVAFPLSPARDVLLP